MAVEPSGLRPERRHALVIGGSMAGLVTARALSKYFSQVTVLERDPVQDRPEARKGQPQTRHLHVLLPYGLTVLDDYFPAFRERLAARGAIIKDVTRTARWYAAGDYRQSFTCGLDGVLASRPLMEWVVRHLLLASSNVTLRDRTDVEGLVFDTSGQRVTGVQTVDRAAGGASATLDADLVVDCGGRGAAAPKWLQAAGYPAPTESVVKIDVGYASRLYRRRPHDTDGYDTILIQAVPPHVKRGAYAFPIEDDRWIVTMGGWHGDHPPSDEAGFMAFARSLPVSDVHDLLVKLEPSSDIVLHKFPSSLRRHYEKLTHFPVGYLVLGDAIASFNPIYGQGMTSAIAQAEGLDRLLAEDPTPEQLASRFFRRAAKIIDRPWQLAVGEDFRYPETTGPKVLGTDLINAYADLVQRATHSDTVVYGEFIRVMSLLHPPTALFRPEIVWRVIRAAQRKPAQAAAV